MIEYGGRANGRLRARPGKDETMEKKRCQWVDGSLPIYVVYHDTEWGVPVRDDGKLYELFLLETFQAGLSWITILKKRENFRRAFDGFDPGKVARYDGAKVEELMADAGIVRCRRKILAAVENAGIFLEIRREFGPFCDYLWGFTGIRAVCGETELPSARTELSDRISADLRRRGMRYAGSVTVYSFLQAAGVVDDHEPGCFCRTRRRLG